MYRCIRFVYTYGIYAHMYGENRTRTEYQKNRPLLLISSQLFLCLFVSSSCSSFSSPSNTYETNVKPEV